MSNTDNHKKAVRITAACRVNKGMLTDIYYRILADQPSAIINAAESLKAERPHGTSGVSPGYGPWCQRIKPVYQCVGCHKMTAMITPKNLCVDCDPDGYKTFFELDNKPKYECKDCHEKVRAVGIAGACIKCDPAGFNQP